PGLISSTAATSVRPPVVAKTRTSKVSGNRAGMVYGAAGGAHAGAESVAAGGPLGRGVDAVGGSSKVATSISSRAPAWVYSSARNSGGNRSLSASARRVAQLEWNDSQWCRGCRGGRK